MGLKRYHLKKLAYFVFILFSFPFINIRAWYATASLLKMAEWAVEMAV
jgi:hypothetical protein